MGRTEEVERTGAKPPARGLSQTVKALGVVSLLSDVSSEMVYPINPVFLTAVLHAPAWALGIIEGIAESTASILKLCSGWVSDRVGRRKPLTALGYGFGALGKPLIAVSQAWPHMLGARFLDRVGKGLRTAPRDALIAENCPPEMRGRAFGFHRGMDTAGAVMGPLIGYVFLWRYSEGYLAAHESLLRNLYWLAFIPGVLGVLALWLFVREKGAGASAAVERPAMPSWGQLSPAYRQYLLIVGLFSIGNSSDAFLLLRAKDAMGMHEKELLLLYAAFNVVEATLAYAAGVLSDRVGRRGLIAAGWGVFALVYLGFAAAHAPAAAWVLFLIYGLYYTLTQGVQRAMAADLAHPERRATEIGAFHMVVGILALPASFVAGWLYQNVHRSAPFFLGAGTAALAAVLLLALAPRPRRAEA